jgi:hypothetical protein
VLTFCLAAACSSLMQHHAGSVFTNWTGCFQFTCLRRIAWLLCQADCTGSCVLYVVWRDDPRTTVTSCCCLWDRGDALSEGRIVCLRQE